MGYPNDILDTRAVIKHGNYAVIPPTRSSAQRTCLLSVMRSSMRELSASKENICFCCASRAWKARIATTSPLAMMG